MMAPSGNEQGWTDLKQPGRTAEEELWKALAWMQRGGIGSLIHAHQEASHARFSVGRGPIAIEYPERREDLRLQYELLERGELVKGKLGDTSWTTAIESFRATVDLYRPLIERARAALPGVARTMDDPALPVAHRFTARVVRLVDRLDAALPRWYRRPGQQPGDEYAERFDGFPNPSGLKKLDPEISEVLTMLRGVWGVEREPAKRPEEIDRVIELVRGNPAGFAPALIELESQYSTNHMRKWCRQTAMFERECSPCPSERDLGWGRYEPSKLKARPGKRNHPGYAVIPNYLMRARTHRNTSAVVPLRLAFLNHGVQTWDPFGDVRAVREAHSKKLAVLVALGFDPDAEEYLADHGAWARIPWWGEGSGEMVGGRSVLRNFDAGNLAAWIGLCEQVLKVLVPPAPPQTENQATNDSAGAARGGGGAVEDYRPAMWFSDATGEAIYPGLLRRAERDGRLRLSRKVASRWQHSIGEVAGCYPQYAEALRKANESAPDETGANASAGTG